jgi:hypothetical protein
MGRFPNRRRIGHLKPFNGSLDSFLRDLPIAKRLPGSDIAGFERAIAIYKLP